MSTNELLDAAERFRDGVYEESDEGHDQFRVDVRKLADAYLAEHPPDDDTPIDDAWLRACGWKTWPEFRGDREFDLYMRAGNDMMWQRRLAWKPHAVWVVRMCDPDENDGLSSEFVSVLGNYGTTARPTRGQLRRLCSALGVELKEPT